MLLCIKINYNILCEHQANVAFNLKDFFAMISPLHARGLVLQIKISCQYGITLFACMIMRVGCAKRFCYRQNNSGNHIKRMVAFFLQLQFAHEFLFFIFQRLYSYRFFFRKYCIWTATDFTLFEKYIIFSLNASVHKRYKNPMCCSWGPGRWFSVVEIQVYF